MYLTVIVFAHLWQSLPAACPMFSLFSSLTNRAWIFFGAACISLSLSGRGGHATQPWLITYEERAVGGASRKILSRTLTQPKLCSWFCVCLLFLD